MSGHQALGTAGKRGDAERRRRGETGLGGQRSEVRRQLAVVL